MKNYICPEAEIFGAQIDSYCTEATISYEVENPSEGGSTPGGGIQEGSVKDDL